MPLRASLCLLLLTAFWSAVYLPALGKRELQGEEARRILPGRTMLQTGEWMVPRSGGEIYNRKPPLVNWVSAASISLSGRMDEWTVRFPATLMMLALALGMFGFLRGWLGNEQAMLATLICLTTIGCIEKGRIIEIEALYISLFGLALVAWLGLRWQRHELAAWTVSGAFLGIGFLAKGPLHVLYFYAIVAGILATERRLSDLRGWRHLMGLLTFVAVWSPWAILNSLRNVQKDSGKVWADQITHRLGFSEFDFVNYLLQVPQSVINFLPWALLLPLCWRTTFADDRHGQWMRGLRKGLLWAFFLIALLPSSRPRFMLPLNVAAAILLAGSLAQLEAGRFAAIARRWRVTLLTVAVLAIIALAVAPWTQPAAENSWTQTHWLAWALWLPVCVLVFKVLKRSPWTRPWTLGTSTALVFGIAISAFSFQVVSRQPWRAELREFAADVQRYIGSESPILLYKAGERMWPFYLGMRCREAGGPESLPPGIDYRWVLTSRKAWDKKSDRKVLTQRYGQPKQEIPMREPHGDTEYVLLELVRQAP